MGDSSFPMADSSFQREPRWSSSAVVMHSLPISQAMTTSRSAAAMSPLLPEHEFNSWVASDLAHRKLGGQPTRGNSYQTVMRSTSLADASTEGSRRMSARSCPSIASGLCPNRRVGGALSPDARIGDPEPFPFGPFQLDHERPLRRRLHPLHPNGWTRCTFTPSAWIRSAAQYQP